MYSRNLIRKYPPKKIEIFKHHNLAKRKYEILEKEFYTENAPDAQINDFTKSTSERKAFGAKLVDGQGNPLANKAVNFNINGVTYNRVTGSEGIAKLNINLQKGEYIITSSYNGQYIANTITVTE